MASDNTQLSAAVNLGDVVRDLADAGGVKWPVAVASYAVTVSPGANVLQVVTPALGMPVVPATGATFNVGSPQRGTLIDRSGTIASGGTSQQLAAANANRNYLLIQNNSSGALWFTFGAGAAVQNQPSIQLPTGAGFVMGDGGFVSTDAVQIIGATTAQAFTAKEG